MESGLLPQSDLIQIVGCSVTYDCGCRFNRNATHLVATQLACVPRVLAAMAAGIYIVGLDFLTEMEQTRRLPAWVRTQASELCLH